MMEKALSRSIRLLCVSGVAFGMHAAHAQETQSAPLQRVEVTGSRIRQVDMETAQPIQVMTQEQIQKTGLVTVGDIINNLASAGTPDFSKGGSLVSNRENGGQYPSLRLLGANRLLTLVDGKRWSASVNGYTDISTIPSSMIERVEILKDGASSIYGSDAIAGVVNIILKKSMEGGQLSLYTGVNEKHGDGRAKDFSLAYGAGTDNASLMFGLTHTEQGAVMASSRPETSTAYGANHPLDALGTGPWGRIRQVGPSGAATGFNQYLNHTGSYNGDGTGAASNVAGNYHPFVNGTPEDTFNSTGQMQFAMPTKLDTIFTKGEVKLPYDMQFKTTAMFAQRTSNSQVAGYPLNSLSQPNYPVYLDKDSYYNPYGNQALGGTGGQDLFFYRRTIERPRTTENESRTTHIDATLAGDFAVRGKTFNWDVGYNHSSVSGSVLGTGNLNLLNLKRALGPSFRNASGVVQCGTAASPIALADCTPFDVLGGPSASTSAALDYVMSTGQATYGSTVNSATANISGEIFDLPAGGLGVAAGLEHREVRGYDRPGQFEQSGYSSDLAGNSTDGRYTVKEAYLEIAVPLLKGKPFAELLSIDVATRHSDYSNFGIANNSKFSFMWKPVRDVLARGTIAEGFRAPTVGDTFGGGQQTFDTYIDPCDRQYGESSRNGEVATRCASLGAPAGFRQLNQNGQPITSVGGSQSPFPFQSGAGNSSLQPETSISKTLGIVYSPSWLPGASASLDWYKVNVNNRITAVDANFITDQCYVKNVSSFCQSIIRDPVTHEITYLERGNANLGRLETSGVDLAANYRFPATQYGRFGLRFDGTYVNSFKTRSEDGAEWVDYAGEYAYNRVKANLSLDWSMGNWGATWTTRYFSPIKDQCWDTDVECSMPDFEASWGTGANKQGALVYHDLNVNYKTSWKGQIQLGINNLLDKKPRNSYEAYIGGYTSSSSVDAEKPIDRFFYVRYNQSF